MTSTGLSLEQRLREAVERFDARSPMGELLHAVLRRLSELEQAARMGERAEFVSDPFADVPPEEWALMVAEDPSVVEVLRRRLSELEQAAQLVTDIDERERFGDETLTGHEWGDAIRRLRAVLSREGNAE